MSRAFRVLLVQPALLFALAACSNRMAVPRDGGTASDAGRDAAHVDAGPVLDIATVTIEPPSATLTSTDGSRPTVDFVAVAHLRDGTMATPLGAQWTRDATDIGDVDVSSGRFTATGIAGGIAMVHLLVPDPHGGAGFTASATVTVTVARAVIAPATPADAATHFAGMPTTDAARAATIVYPLDGAVMPQNVAPADVQWLNGAMGDVYRITLAKTHATVVGYAAFGTGFQNAWLVDADGWRSIATTDPDESASISVDRWVSAGGAVIGSPPVHVRFARGVVLGSVYYWDLGAGQSIRIDDGTTARVQFMPYPPGSTATGSGCIGCHAISHDGRYLSAETGDFQGAVFDLTTDLTARTAPTVFPLGGTSPAWFWSSFNPDSTRIVADHGGLGLYDVLHGASIAPLSGSLPAANAAQPVWSPDGNAIAYAANIDSGSGNVDFTHADIGVVPVTGPDSFGTPTIVHTGASLASAVPPGSSDNYPTWSPDSQWIAFGHGDGYRGDTDHDALYLVAATGGATTRLDRACGGPSTTNDYIPNFSPFDTGGYFWITFQSTRDYGNVLAGTRGTRRPQVWVAAIADHPTAGTDPSEVAYWLPGQDAAKQNIEAYWAPHACRRNADTCSVSSECCSGECRDDGTGHLSCVAPPPERCRVFGETCSTTADCCAAMDLVCQGNVCLTMLR